MKRGFTLVELSIVLVIIGLLISGILVAQSMVDTAKIQAFLRQIGQFDAAVANFQTKYTYLPGDATSFGCTNTGNNTCNDNLLEDANYGDDGPITDTFSGEVANFWPQLQESGFINPKRIAYSNGNGTFTLLGATPNSPQMPLGANTGVIVMGIGAGVTGGPYVTTNQHYYVTCNFKTLPIPNGSIHIACGSQQAIPAVDALAIDKKIDDGLTDDISGDKDGVNVFDYNSANCYEVGSVGGNAYNTSNPAAMCSLAIRMFSTNNAQQ